MKIFLRLLSFAALIASGALLFFAGKKYLPNLLVQDKQKYSAHWQKTAEKSLQELETLQISSEYVFPYDFIEKPYPQNWAVLNLKNSEHYRDNSENINKKFYETVKNMGIDLAKEGKNFLILRAEVRMGFNLKEKTHRLTAKTGPTGVSLQIVLPEPEILAFNIEMLPQKEGWPSMTVSPESWALLAKFLEAEIRHSLLNEQTRALVKDNAQNLLRGILKETGFGQIDFVYENSK